MSEAIVCERRLYRALSQRIYVLSTHTEDDMVLYEVMGSQGTNVYTVIVSMTGFCTCTCPDYEQRGGFCKHILNVLCKVLQIRPAEIATCGWRGCVAQRVTERVTRNDDETVVDNARGDMECCICYEPLQTRQTQCEQCKHIFHLDCMNHWFRVRGNTCPLCRYTLVGQGC